MATNLVIVESPAKAKTIKKYLGSNYKVVASMGHVRDLPKSKLGIDVENNYEPQYISIRGKGDLISSLKKDAKGAKKVYLATDPDREGEAISWHLSTLLGLEEGAENRISFNEITKTAVQNGLKNPRAIDMDLVNAQQARRLLDRLVGYKISPFLWKKIRKGLSAGRVQSVATRLIVDREDEINAFVPKEYWSIDAELKKGKDKAFTARFHGDTGGKIEVASKDEADAITADLEKAQFKVGKIKKGSKKRNPLPPFITSTLQQDASRRLNMQARRTMRIAQELYEGIEIGGEGLVGLITYMRTDSLRISADAQSEAKDYIIGKYGPEYYPGKPRVYRSNRSAQDAHEAIRPTSVAITPESVKKSLSKDQYNLYKLIWERFVASQMQSMTLATVSVDIEADCGKKHPYLYKASGFTVTFPGYSVLYDDTKDEKEEGAGKLFPELADGDPLNLVKLLPEQHFTQPPPRYTEASLIKAMEENGIGRPSTYAPTISTIQQREYVVREGKAFKPTALGMVTTTLMKDHFADVVDIDFTATMEESLDKVEQGDADWIGTVDKFYRNLQDEIDKAEAELGDTRYTVPDEETDEVCELCGKNMVVKSGRYGKFLACPGYPECKNTKPIVIDTGGKCPKCDGRILKRSSKNGNTYYACENNPTCDFMTWYQPAGRECPKCGKSLLYKGAWKKNVVCSNADCDYEEKDSAKKKAQ